MLDYDPTESADRAAKERRFAALLADKRRREEEAGHQSDEEASLEAERKPLLESATAFFYWALAIMQPGKRFARSWHYELLGEYAELLYQRKILYFIGNVPPRTAKSLFLSVAFPAWVWARDPLPSFLGASVDKDLATGFNEKRRALIEHPEYQRLFGYRVELQRGHNRADDFANTRGGEMKIASPGGEIIGRGGDFIPMDDILPPDTADSTKKATTTTEWFDSTLMQRRNDVGNSPMMLIEQRTGESDMTAHLTKSVPADQLVHVSIPLVAEERTEYVFPISGRVHVREKDDVLMPEIFTPKALAALKLRARIYSTQYQQKPIGKGGKTFKREWFRYYGPKHLGYEEQLPPMHEMDSIVQSWDAAFKAKEESDMVAGHVYARRGPKKYLLDRIAERMTFTETIAAILAMRARHPYASRIYIEDKANGPAIIDVMNKRIGGIIPVEPLGSKEARADAASADIESGHFYLPCAEIHPWVGQLVDYLCAFPSPLINDDDVDALSQAFAKMGSGNDGLLDFYSAKAEAQKDPILSIFEAMGV